MPQYTPYWWEEAPRPELPETPVEAKCDVAIIGSGYAGLAASLELQRRGRSVQVFDKGVAGGGGSSRSGGIASGNIRISFSRMIKTLGLERAKAYYGEGIEARRDLARFIADEKLDCQFQPVGLFRGATRPAHCEQLAREADALNEQFDIGVTTVSRSAQGEEIGSDFFHGGIVRPDIGGLHPGRLHQGMLDLALKSGVLVHAHTAVIGFRRENARYDLATSRGTVSARDVIVCTNAYSDGAVPWLRKRIVPVPSMIIATEPIPKKLMNRLCPKGRMLGDTGRIHNYFRPSPDGSRILLGSRSAGALQPDGPVGHDHLSKELKQIFPELAEVDLSHVWWGYVAMNLDHLPQLVVKDGVHYATGFCGSGVVWARWFGRKAAQKVLGDPAGASAFENQRFSAIPFYRGNPWFLPATVGWFRLLDRLGL